MPTNDEIEHAVDIAFKMVSESSARTDRLKLLAAAAEQSVAIFEYRKSDESQYSVRVVRLEDFGTGVDRKKDGRFEYVVAYDYDRADYRTFRLSRIRNGSVKVCG